MKKVMIAVTTLYGGGAERVVSIWANQLVEMGYEVSILVYGRVENEYPVDDRIFIHTIATTYEEYKKMNYIQRLRKMRCIVRDVDADVIINFLPRMQIWMMFATLCIDVYRIETVRVSPWIICSNSKVEKALWKLCMYRADKIVIQTPEQGEFFNDYLKKKCCVISNPISEEILKKEIVINPNNNKRFIAVGRITPQKNYEMMIRAFKLACDIESDITLSIFGAGDEKYKAKLIKLINDLELSHNVVFKGRSNDIPGELEQHNVFLMTSLFEGMPNALLEAMASGLICVSTDCKTGPKDIIRNGENGFLVDINDIDLLAQTIINIINMNETEKLHMGIIAQETIAAFCSSEKSKAKLASLIERS